MNGKIGLFPIILPPSIPIVKVLTRHPYGCNVRSSRGFLQQEKEFDYQCM